MAITMEELRRKARAYDEVREKIALRFGSNVAEEIFPELKESEDERVRKLLIRLFTSNANEKFDDISTQEIVAWLEKQSKESKVEESMREVEEKAEAFAAAHQGENADVILAEMRGEIKPKFHEGDWIISNNKKYIYQVIEVKRGIYVIRDNADNREYHVGIESADRDGRLWTIKDAKDGDILVTIKKQPFIFNGHYDEDTDYIYGYCGISDLVKDDSFYANEENVEEECNVWCVNENVYPATKEQCDTLMIAMTDAGYTFDFEKKELKKLGQQEVTKMSDKVKDSAWSEEDEIIYAELIKYFESLLNCLATKERYNENGRWLNWLKSLKFRKQWKPSEEQMNALAEALILAKNCGEESAFDLRTLYEQLKKL